jgi:pilus assembly protein TadC
MTEPSQNDRLDTLNQISSEAKNFYSAGAAFSTFACSGVVRIVWAALDRIYPPFESELTALLLSFLIVLAYALVIPEPKNYPNAGKMRITLSEGIFGFANTFIVFALAIAIKNL